VIRFEDLFLLYAILGLVKKVMSGKVFYGLATVIVVVGCIFLFAHTAKPAPVPATAASLASLSTGPAPWTPEYQHLPSRLKAINLPLLGAEGSALHIHVHVDIYVNGKVVTVPADIGIPPSGGITPVHTHDTSGIIHIESPDAHATYTLGQLFDIWGVKLTDTSVGSYGDSSTQKLVVYSNGNEVTNPVNLPFEAHEEIVITYGTTQQIPTIPTTYQFPAGL
jgi:hypothetical protein